MEMAAGNFPGIKTTQGVDPISHAFFDDESLFLRGASKNIAKYFKRSLHSFYVASRGKINYKKNSFINGIWIRWISQELHV